jgi:hypothetical protein
MPDFFSNAERLFRTGLVFHSINAVLGRCFGCLPGYCRGTMFAISEKA